MISTLVTQLFVYPWVMSILRGYYARLAVSLITECICLKRIRLHGYRALCSANDRPNFQNYTRILIHKYHGRARRTRKDDEVRLYTRIRKCKGRTLDEPFTL